MPEAAWVDALELATTSTGAAWGHAGDQLDVTLLAWPADHAVDEHVNVEREVVLVGVSGSGVCAIEDDEHDLRAGVVLVVPRGALRTIRAGANGLAYVSAHRARGLLQVTQRS